MIQNQHQFHIPVMGTGHSIDSPIRVAHLSIHSVISVVDDMLCEKIRKHYCGEFNLPYNNIPRSATDGRAEHTRMEIADAKALSGGESPVTSRHFSFINKPIE